MHWTERYRKAVTFSYDDGNEQDIRLVELLNTYGMKCTFNLNSGLGSDNGTWVYKDQLTVHRLDLAEYTDLYTGHEIAVHGSEHLNLTELDSSALRWEIFSDRDRLAQLFGKVPVGMAYPYGACNPQVKRTIRLAGLRYARTVDSSYSFDVPEDLLAFAPTCHHDDDRLFELAQRFRSMEPDVPQIFCIWGHSYELEGNHNWDRLERLCEMLAGREDIFCGTNAEVLL